MATKIKYAPNALKARATALSWVGKKFSPGWCLYWCLVYVYKVPGLGDYDHDGDADATDYWKAAIKRGQVVHAPADAKKLPAFIKAIPAGVLLQWTGGARGYGHAAYSLGDGQMVSTDLPTRGKVGKVPIDKARTAWGLKLVGYVLVDGNGFTLVQPEKPEPTPPEPTVYKVNTKAGLRGRQAPSTKSKTLGTLKLNDKVTQVKIVTGDSRHWVYGTDKRYYAMEYLTRV